MALAIEIKAWIGGSQLSRYYCHRDSLTKLGGGTDDHDDPFANDVEEELEEDEAVIENE